MIELLRGVKRPIQGLSLGGRVSKANSVCETKSKGVDRGWSVRLFPAVARSVSTTDFNRVISDLKILKYSRENKLAEIFQRIFENLILIFSFLILTERKRERKNDSILLF